MSNRCAMIRRREFLKGSAAALIASPLAAGGGGVSTARAQPAGPGEQLSSVKALVFDTFGTVVDWRTSVTQDVEQLAKRKGLTVDGAKFADAWRAGYGPSMNRVRSGDLPWTKLDGLHRMILDEILIDFGITGLSEAETDALNRAWHRLRSWPDAVAGLTRLKKRFTIAPLSNGNISLMTALAKHSGLPWDCILGAELVRRYKPRSRGLSVGRRHSRPQACRGHDGGGALGGPARRKDRGTAYRVCGPATRVRAEWQARLEG